MLTTFDYAVLWACNYNWCPSETDSERTAVTAGGQVGGTQGAGSQGRCRWPCKRERKKYRVRSKPTPVGSPRMIGARHSINRGRSAALPVAQPLLGDPESANTAGADVDLDDWRGGRSVDYLPFALLVQCAARVGFSIVLPICWIAQHARAIEVFRHDNSALVHFSA